jgi:hypothetical protein
MEDRRRAYSVLVGTSEGRRPLVTPRHTREDNIKRYSPELGCKHVLN